MNLYTDNAYLGFCEVDITPNTQMETIGFGRADNLSRGVEHPLCAAVAVWQFKGKWSCLVTIDHIGFSKTHAAFLREKIGTELKEKKEAVMLCFSHTHAAPNDSVETNYFSFVCEKILEGLSYAKKYMNPIKAAFANGVASIGVNRRPECQALDRRVGILQITHAVTEEPLLLILRLTAHANVLKEDNYAISPDYFGAVRDRLSKKYRCSVMLTQGASGNVAPKYFSSDLIPIDASDERFVRSPHAMDKMADEVEGEVSSVIDTMKPQEIYRLSIDSVYQTFQADVPSNARAQEVAEEAKREAGIDGAAWLAEVERLNWAGIAVQDDETEIQFFRLNDGCFCGVSHEIMCEFALSIWKELNNPYFYFGGYTNGCTGYFPTEEEFDKGGYEVYWSMLIYYRYHRRVFPLKRESARELMDRIISYMKSYR